MLAARAMGKKMGARMGAAGQSMSTQMGAAGTAMQSTNAYRGIQSTAGQKIQFELTYGQVGITLALAILYMIISSVGIDIFSKCTELEGKSVHDNLSKWLIATLGVALAIPFTLILVKSAGTKLTPIMILIFAILGIVGSSASLHWSSTCSNADESKKIYSGINLASFLCMLIGAIFFMTRKSTPKIALQ